MQATTFMMLMTPFFALSCVNEERKAGGDNRDSYEYDLRSDADAGLTDTGLPSLEDTGGGDATGEPGSFDGGIVGRVCDPAGGWVVTAYVYTTYDSTGDGVHDARAEDETDANGAYELSGLPGGRDYVVVAEKGSFEATFNVTVGAGITEIAVDECMLNSPNIAVVTGQYDHIEDIIGGLGLDYTVYDGLMTTEYLDFLRNPHEMATYDIIFFNCGMRMDWYFTEEFRSEISTNINAFVRSGGSIYTSDWAYYMVEAAFADEIDFYGDDTFYGDAQFGLADTVEVTVMDPAIEAIIGDDSAEIVFDRDSWVVMEGVASDVDVLLSADVPISTTWGSGATLSNKPITVRFEVDAGQVLFTSFHNEHEETTLDMTDILEEAILSL